LEWVSFYIFMQQIIELEKVTKRFGGITALNQASLSVQENQH